MADYSVYRYPAPAASFVVRLVRSGDQVQGFIRQVQEEDDPKAYYPSEQMPAAEALELAAGRTEGAPGARVFVELDPDVDWDPAWGRLH